MHGMLLRPAAGHAQQPLQFEPALQRIDLKSQLRNKLGQLPELPQIGGGMHPPQESGAGRSERFGHGFVGREHEFFDDLVALGILHDMRTRDAAIAIEIDLHFRHLQFQRPPR